MWQCCSYNDEAVVNTIQKEESNEDIGVTIDSTKNKYFIRRSNTPKELVMPYSQCQEMNKFCKDFKELIEGYENDEGECIDMSQPRDVSYSSKTKYNTDTRQNEIFETKTYGEDMSIEPKNLFETTSSNHQSHDPSNYRSMPTEVRGITLRQLRAIIPLIKRRCKKEKWTRPIYVNGKRTGEVETVTLENATLYDVNKYIIKPFTEYSKMSFVETLPSTKGTQPPRWFVR